MTEPMPPQQPPASPPAQSGWSQYQPQAAAGWPRERGTPGSVLLVGIVLLIFGLLIGLGGVILVFASSFLEQMGTLGTPIVDPETGEAIDAEVALGMVEGFVVGFGIVLLVVALGHLAAGIGIMRRSGWARVLGILLAVIGVLIWGLAVLGSLAALGQPGAEDAIGGVIVTAVVAVIYLWSFIVLLRRGEVFRRA
jgi:hypothetical protein